MPLITLPEWMPDDRQETRGGFRADASSPGWIHWKTLHDAALREVLSKTFQGEDAVAWVVYDQVV